jgi:hypothetical protein
MRLDEPALSPVPVGTAEAIGLGDALIIAVFLSSPHSPCQPVNLCGSRGKRGSACFPLEMLISRYGLLCSSCRGATPQTQHMPTNGMVGLQCTWDGDRDSHWQHSAAWLRLSEIWANMSQLTTACCHVQGNCMQGRSLLAAECTCPHWGLQHDGSGFAPVVYTACVETSVRKDLLVNFHRASHLLFCALPLTSI